MSAAPTLWDVVRYFLRLGATGFGGPIALAHAMRGDLVDRRAWFTEEEYERGLAVATICPGPLAYQLGVYFGYIKSGLLGAVSVGFAFGIAPFAIVVALAAIYMHFSSTLWIRGLFYGVGPVVVALIVKACWNLGIKTLRREPFAWTIAGFACTATLLVQGEITLLFVIAGAVGAFIFAPRGPVQGDVAREATPSKMSLREGALPIVLAAAVPTALPPIVWQLFAFFFKTGLLVFGSGLVVVSFLKAYVVDQYHWIGDRAFLDAVAVGMVSPGPVVIMATFVGYVVGGFGGASAATVGIFLPSILFTVVGTPLLVRFGKNPRVAGFVRGVTVAVVGVLAGTTVLVGKPVIGDWLTALVALVVLLLSRFRKGIPDQVYVAAGACIGLVLYPILRPTWLP